MGGEVKLEGASLIGFRRGRRQGEKFHAVNPVTGEPLAPEFFTAQPTEVDEAARLARDAFAEYSLVPGRDKALLLRKIAAAIEAVKGEVVERAALETALPKARLETETARTTGQLRLFAQLVEEGSWVMARIDRAQPERKPAPKPDIRSMLRPLGPVVVFGASNFPLAFSVAGGDTASALAAGNPVIAKAHPAHPGTSELVGLAVSEAVRESKLPEGVFSLLFDGGHDVGEALVQHPLVKACGFTGSRTAGLSLMKLASARPEPIPFYAEMSSTNPVFILPGALRKSGEKIAAGLYSSFTLGAGQFCTKPGMVFLSESAEGASFVASLEKLVSESGSFHLLTEGIRSAYAAGVEARKRNHNLKLVREVGPGAGTGVGAALFETDAGGFLGDASLGAEIFGPATLVVTHARREDLVRIARGLEGHLTATVHGTDEDLGEFRELISILEQKAGRLIFNGFPTGVEVSDAMVHGGPFPATSDGRSTSVGTQAIYRFCRPVAYQGFPANALPDELKDSNPLGIWRMVDGEMTREKIAQPQLGAAG
ncbi:MAG: aldehyde dehydrogenase (NADP(+)) [Acidobacteria bacterium]|nr:aldehyde dehydrogenase (NADP(+)) [Acidobacteriota bacterium]